MPPRPSRSIGRRLGAAASASLGLAALLTTLPVAASAAVFFPRGSGARVERHHVTVALTASGTVAWNAVDIAGSAADVGVIVAVKPGGRVELAGRVWIDVIEVAAQVNVSAIAPGVCKAFGGGAVVSGNGEAGIQVQGSGSVEPSGGCSGGASGRADGGGAGGCYGKSSSSSGGCGGCDGCDGIEPSENGHPGCSAFFACASVGPGEGSSSGSSGGPAPPRRGPYDVVRVRASDGSARAWLDTNGYDPGVSFEEAAAAVERDGYELLALRARAPSSPSLVQSLRVITTSPTPTLPLRLVRMGGAAASPATALTLVVVANAPQRLVDTEMLRIDESRLRWSGSTSNYESLVLARLGGEAPAGDSGGASTDGGAPDSGAALPSATRWLVESSRSMANQPTSRAGEAEAGAPKEGASLADLFRAQCGDRIAEKHAVCAAPGTPGGNDDAGTGDGGGNDDGGDDGGSDASLDASTESDASAEDASVDGGASGSPGCTDVDRSRCDDIDLAIPPAATAVVTRFRGVVTGDAVATGDLAFALATDRLPEGRYWVRADGEPGLCETPPGSSSGGESEQDGQTCRQTPGRRWSGPNLGPILVLFVAIRAVAAIMRRARSRDR